MKKGTTVDNHYVRKGRRYCSGCGTARSEDFPWMDFDDIYLCSESCLAMLNERRDELLETVLRNKK